MCVCDSYTYMHEFLYIHIYDWKKNQYQKQRGLYSIIINEEERQETKYLWIYFTLYTWLYNKGNILHNYQAKSNFKLSFLNIEIRVRNINLMIWIGLWLKQIEGSSDDFRTQ